MADNKQTLSTQCFERITEEILNGQILPGEKLLCEVLKERYKVGMSPVREALSKLAAKHLVTFEEHKGYSVAKLNADWIRDDIKTFAYIECLALRQSIEQGDDAWEGEFVAALHCLKKAEASKKIEFFQWAPHNKRFHNALVMGCPLKSLMEIRHELYMRHQWYILLSYKFANETVIAANHKEHQEIADLALARSIEDCARLLFDHITAGVEQLIVNLQMRGLLHE